MADRHPPAWRGDRYANHDCYGGPMLVCLWRLSARGRLLGILVWEACNSNHLHSVGDRRIHRRQTAKDTRPNSACSTGCSTYICRSGGRNCGGRFERIWNRECHLVRRRRPGGSLCWIPRSAGARHPTELQGLASSVGRRRKCNPMCSASHGNCDRIGVIESDAWPCSPAEKSSQLMSRNPRCKTGTVAKSCTNVGGCFKNCS
jgi:hypothetical protein